MSLFSEVVFVDCSIRGLQTAIPETTTVAHDKQSLTPNDTLIEKIQIQVPLKICHKISFSNTRGPLLLNNTLADLQLHHYLSIIHVVIYTVLPLPSTMEYFLSW